MNGLSLIFAPILPGTKIYTFETGKWNDRKNLYNK